MSNGIIYYTDNTIDDPIRYSVMAQLLKADLPITSASFKPINFGDNAVIEGKRSYITIIRQVISCLERSHEDNVFFCEHDVLYPQDHFLFIPYRNDVFFYNKNVLRWKFGEDHLIGYGELVSLSSLCVNREFALEHFRERLDLILSNGWDKEKGHEPYWARRMGYEPGKTRSRGGYFDNEVGYFYSLKPIIDIRHPGTFSRSKTTLREFKHQPKDWKEISIDWVEGWDLKEMFHL